MKLRVLCFSLLMLAMGGSLFAQNAAPIQGGSISASSSNCTASFSCLWESVLPQNAGTTTINISGTFSATLLVEESNNGGQTWSTAATLSAAGTTTYSTNGFTDIRVRCSAYTSGTAVISISTGLQQVQSVVSGGSSSGASFVSSLPATCTPGVTANVQASVAINTYIAGTQFYCSATNTWSPDSLTSQVGTFTNTVPPYHYYSVRGDMGTLPCPADTVEDGSAHTDAVLGCVNIPSSGVTNAFNNAIGGYVLNNNPNSTGVFGKVQGVGINGVCGNNANNTKCEGVSAQAQDNVGALTGTVIIGVEVGNIPQNTTTSGYGVLASFEGANSQPTGDNMPAFVVQTPTGTGTWTSGLKCENGATSSGNGQICVGVGKRTTSGITNSQNVVFTGNNGASDITGQMSLASPGYLSITGNGNNAGYTTFGGSGAAGTTGGTGIWMRATAALNANQLVKIDAANIQSVIVTATTDTTGTFGIVIDPLGSGTGGACGAGGTFCAVIMGSGQKVKGILGTGTCAIGNFVIVDTTTAGDVKCTAVQPAQGAWIGTAINLQNTVGQTVDFLTKFQ